MLYPYMDLDLSKIMDAHNVKSTLLVFVKHIILFHKRLQRRSNTTNYGIRYLLWTFLRDGYRLYRVDAVREIYANFSPSSIHFNHSIRC